MNNPHGSYAEEMAVAEGLLAPVPASLSFEQAASLPLAGLTAWQVSGLVQQLGSFPKCALHVLLWSPGVSKRLTCPVTGTAAGAGRGGAATGAARADPRWRGRRGQPGHPGVQAGKEGA